MKTLYSCLIAGFLAIFTVFAFAHAGAKDKTDKNVNHGAFVITIPTAPMPSVSFPHMEHQDNLGNCKLCHDLFPKKAGIISAMKADKRLARKEVMNKKCLACHRKRIKAGKSAGPVRCRGCHSIK